MEVTRRLRFSVRTIFGISVHDTICEYEYDEIWKKHKLRMGGSIITLEYMRHASWEAFGQARRCTTVFCPLIVWEMMLTTKTKGIINRLSAFAIKNEKKKRKTCKVTLSTELIWWLISFPCRAFFYCSSKKNKNRIIQEKKNIHLPCVAYDHLHCRALQEENKNRRQKKAYQSSRRCRAYQFGSAWSKCPNNGRQLPPIANNLHHKDNIRFSFEQQFRFFSSHPTCLRPYRFPLSLPLFLYHWQFGFFLLSYAANAPCENEA